MTALGRAWIEVSDPWDFGTAYGTGPFLVTILERRDNELLLRLGQVFDVGGREFSLVIAAPRYDRSRYPAPGSRRRVPSVFLPAGTNEQDARVVAGNWRSGHLLGSVWFGPVDD